MERTRSRRRSIQDTPSLFDAPSPPRLRAIPVGAVSQAVYMDSDSDSGAEVSGSEVLEEIEAAGEQGGVAARRGESVTRHPEISEQPEPVLEPPDWHDSPRPEMADEAEATILEVSSMHETAHAVMQSKSSRPEPVATEPEPARAAKSASRRAARSQFVTAETLASKQRDISVSEFFAKNRHLLGFDNKRKALLTTVKEAVDNSLDACEEAHILPEINIHIDQLAEDRFRVTVRDNGPGIVRAQIANIFGKLLYGSKFHRLKMSRGQQGIGISAAGMYGVLTTGKSVHIISRTSPKKPAHYLEIQMDTARNRADVIKDDEIPDIHWERGTEVVIELVATYSKGRQSVDEYIEQTAIANPHAVIRYRSPTGEHREFPRGSEELPAETCEIQPHPHGIELGVLMKMLKDARPLRKGERTPSLSGFLQREFSRVTSRVANAICEQAALSPKSRPAQIGTHDVERLYQAMQSVKIMAPPTNCLAPIGARNLLAGMLKEVKAEFYTATTRDPSVYRGNPFQIEIALAYGGTLAADQAARVIRFANRVPLLYQQSACAAFKSVLDVDWRNYGLSQPGNSLPVGPLVIMVHMASVWVPFTSESKEAIADYDEIRKEMKLALQECGRKLAAYLRRRRRQRMEADRRSIFGRYIPDVAEALANMTGVSQDRLVKHLNSIAKTRTAEADVQLDEDGRPIAPAAASGAALARAVARGDTEQRSNRERKRAAKPRAGHGEAKGGSKAAAASGPRAISADTDELSDDPTTVIVPENQVPTGPDDLFGEAGNGNGNGANRNGTNGNGSNGRKRKRTRRRR
jgi:DNA topoisomerase-6 subunit B